MADPRTAKGGNRMSGIYIPGVTVPENNTILLRIFPESDGICYTEQLDIDGDILDKYFAIPVPEHGRCIDADGMVESLANLLKFPSNLVNGQWIVNTIREQHTIIPADKEGEG